MKPQSRWIIYLICSSLLAGMVGLSWTMLREYPERADLWVACPLMILYATITVGSIVFDLRRSWEDVRIVGHELEFAQPGGKVARIPRQDIARFSRGFLHNPLNLITLHRNDGSKLLLRAGVGVGPLQLKEDPLTTLRMWLDSTVEPRPGVPMAKLPPKRSRTP